MNHVSTQCYYVYIPKQVFCVYQVPSASVTVEGGCALNRVRWATGGREVAVGDSEGRVWIYDVGEVITPTS